MKRIYKYKLALTDVQSFDIPKGFIPISVIELHNELVLYVQVDTNEMENERYEVYIFGTGNPIEGISIQNLRYFFTHKIQGDFGDTLVWHVFGKRQYIKL